MHFTQFTYIKIKIIIEDYRGYTIYNVDIFKPKSIIKNEYGTP